MILGSDNVRQFQVKPVGMSQTKKHEQLQVKPVAQAGTRQVGMGQDGSLIAK